MSSKAEKDKVKQLQDKCQSVLNALLRDEDNKYCVDCDSKGPRWASWNLGVFLCIRCAGIHRNLGVHISKVKSVNLDSWTPEQVVSLQQMGNSRARAVYEANMPDNFRRPQNDSNLESFIRAKYEHKKYIAREWVPPSLPEVNWEKEIDEEIERQKRKKKTVVEKKSLGSVEVPQLPKPKNASPKPGRIVQVQPVAPPPPTETKLSTDLLGLQNGDDSFSNFLSAPVPASSTTTTSEKKPEEKSDPAKSEEESFFNQTAPSEKEKVKLTKDSILALYGSAPPVNNFNSTYNPAPTGQFNAGFPVQSQQQQPQQQNFQNFGQFPSQQQQQPQQFPVQNGMPQYQTNTQFPNQFPNQFGLNNQFQMPAQNFQYPNNLNQFNPHMMQNTQIPSSQFQMNQFPQPQSSFPAQAPNPFFNPASNNIQQQFGNMSLNGQKPAVPPTVPTNIWQ